MKHAVIAIAFAAAGCGTPEEGAEQGLDVESVTANEASTSSLSAAPSNDTFANASNFTLNIGETIKYGTTLGSTHDGPSPCGCTSGGNVWYGFYLPTKQQVYVDTAGTGFDTSVFIVDDAGNLVSGSCNDDAFCTGGDWRHIYESRATATLNPGYYRIAVGGCSSGNFVLRVQHLGPEIAYTFVWPQLVGSGTYQSYLVGDVSKNNLSPFFSSYSAEQARWFMTCGNEAQFFSLCPEDGANYEMDDLAHGWSFVPTLNVVAGYTGNTPFPPPNSGLQPMANWTNFAGLACHGTMGQTHWGEASGPRLSGTAPTQPNAIAPRGINAIIVDERLGTGGIGMMDFILRYDIR